MAAGALSSADDCWPGAQYLLLPLVCLLMWKKPPGLLSDSWGELLEDTDLNLWIPQRRGHFSRCVLIPPLSPGTKGTGVWCLGKA